MREIKLKVYFNININKKYEKKEASINIVRPLIFSSHYNINRIILMRKKYSLKKV